MESIWLCMALLVSPNVPATTAARACAVSDVFVESAAMYGHDPVTLVAIAWQETNVKPHLIGSSGECGAMQVLPQYSKFSCRQLQTYKGIVDGSRALRAWSKGGRSVKESAYRYNCGYRRKDRCQKYASAVMRKIQVIRTGQRRLSATSPRT